MADGEWNDEWRATVTVTDKDGHTVGSWSALKSASVDQNALYGDYIDEARSQFRYYGTLRAQISWLPAIIALTIFSIVLPEFYSARWWVLIWPVLFLGTVLVLIFRAQRYLERLQYMSRLLADLLQRKVLGESGIDVEAGSYNAILMGVSNRLKENKSAYDNYIRHRWDGPTNALMWFFIVIFIAYIAAAIYLNCEARAITGMGECTAAAVPVGQPPAEVIDSK